MSRNSTVSTNMWVEKLDEDRLKNGSANGGNPGIGKWMIAEFGRGWRLRRESADGACSSQTSSAWLG